MDFDVFLKDFSALPPDRQRAALADLHRRAAASEAEKPIPRLPDEERRALPAKPRPENLRAFAERASKKREADKAILETLNAQIQQAQRAKQTYLARLVHEDEEAAFAGALGADFRSIAEEAEKLLAEPTPSRHTTDTPEFRALIAQVVTEALKSHSQNAKPSPASALPASAVPETTTPSAPSGAAAPAVAADAAELAAPTGGAESGAAVPGTAGP